MSELDVDDIKDEAMRMAAASVRGQHSNSKVVRLCSEITALRSRLAEAVAACRPIIEEAKQREDYMHPTFNPDAHVELTLTIAEIRAIHAVVAKAEGW